MDENLSRGYCSFTGAESSGESSPTSTSTDKCADNHDQEHGSPKDSSSRVYLALVLAGAGFLLPYNSFITAVDYFQHKYPGTTIVFDMSLTYICIAFLAVCINNVLVETFSVNVRITFGYVVSFWTLLLVAVFEVWYEVLDPSLSYGFNLVAVAVVSFGCTVQQSSFYGYTSMLPRRYTQAVMTGESAAGLIVSINRIVTKAFLNNEKTNTMIFFCISVVTVFACSVVFHFLRRTEFVRYHTDRCRISGLDEDLKGITYDTTYPEEVEILDSTSNGSYGITSSQGTQIPRERSKSNENQSTTALPGVSFSDYKSVKIGFLPAIKRGILVRYRAAKTVWTYMMSIALAYFVTLALFPGIETEIVSCNLGSWMPVIIMGIFNACDFIGKIIASIKYDWPRGRLVLCSLCRCLLIPLMMLAASPREDPVIQNYRLAFINAFNTHHHYNVACVCINNTYRRGRKVEAWSLILSAILGLSNGYFGSVPMILAPGKVKDEHKEITGNIMTLSYSIGLTFGSGMAYLLDAWMGEPLGYDPCASNGSHIVKNGSVLLRNYAFKFSPIRHALKGGDDDG